MMATVTRSKPVDPPAFVATEDPIPTMTMTSRTKPVDPPTLVATEDPRKVMPVERVAGGGFKQHTQFAFFARACIVLAIYTCYRMWLFSTGTAGSEMSGATAVDRNVPHRANGSGNTTLPTILLAGIQKAGTTALAKWLLSPNSLNKGVCKPAVFDGEPEYYAKEVAFFNNDTRYQRGVAFYERRFRHCLADPNAARSGNGTLLSMDATPDLLQFPWRVFGAYKRAGQLRSLKVVVSLREPISRELSW